MYNLLVKLMVITAIIHLGLSFKDFQNCHSRQCTQQLEKRSRDVLHVDWKSISLFVRPDKRMSNRPQQDGLGLEIAGPERGC